MLVCVECGATWLFNGIEYARIDKGPVVKVEHCYRQPGIGDC